MVYSIAQKTIGNGGMKLRLKQILSERNLKQRWLVEQLDLSPGYVSHLVNNQKLPSPALLSQIAEVLDIPSNQLIDADRHPVAVAGRVGAGHQVELVDSYAKGDGLYHVAAPEDLPASGIVAVEVSGESMSPMFEDGDILFFSRHFIGIDEAVLGSVGILATEDGLAMVKQIKPGREPGTFDLYSVNPTVPPIYGARLSWAAPWRRHLRKQDVEIVEP